MNISQIGNTAAAGQVNSANGANSADMQKTEFLELLVEQLKHQDPMDPMKQEEYAAQLAQFSSLEQLTNLNTKFDQMYQSNMSMNQSITNALSTNLIGKNVRAIGNQLTYSETGNNAVSFRLMDDAQNVKVKIKNAEGNVLRVESIGAMTAGQQTWAWDGKFDGKGSASDGANYIYEVSATKGDDQSVDVRTFVDGEITGVEFGGQGVMNFLVGDVRVSTSEVERIYTTGEAEE